jgi:hypothetical protein
MHAPAGLLLFRATRSLAKAGQNLGRDAVACDVLLENVQDVSKRNRTEVWRSAKNFQPLLAAEIERLAQTDGVLDGFPTAPAFPAALGDAEEEKCAPGALFRLDEHVIVSGQMGVKPTVRNAPTEASRSSRQLSFFHQCGASRSAPFAVARLVPFPKIPILPSQVSSNI